MRSRQVLSGLIRCVFVVVLVAGGTVVCDGQNLEQVLPRIGDSRMKSNVERSLKRFRDSELKATRLFLREIGERERAFKANSPAGASRPYEKQAADLKLWVESGGTFPAANEFLDITFRYAMSVANARDVLKPPVAALAKGLQRSEPSQARTLEIAFENTGRILDAKEIVTEKSKWNGHRQGAKSKGKTPLRFVIESVDGSRFNGRVAKWYQYSNHAVHELSGTIDGAKFRAITGPKRNLAGGDEGRLVYDGFVFGRTIYGTFSGQDQKGKPASGTFRVDL